MLRVLAKQSYAECLALTIPQHVKRAGAGCDHEVFDGDEGWAQKGVLWLVIP